jgi:IclR family transcriptional regulator, acetate operon repressor
VTDTEDADGESGARRPVKSAIRTVEILECLSQMRGMHSLRELQEVLGFPKSSLFALLRTLVDLGWVESDRTGTLYGVGLRALLAGTSYIDGDEVVARAGSTLTWLASKTTETVHLARLDGVDVVYLETRDSTHELRVISRVGRRLPAHSTSLGKALLAQLTDEEVRALLPSRLEALTPHTITDVSVLLDQLAEARRHGYATDLQENTLGVRCISRAIAYRGTTRDAISCSVPISRFTDDRERTLAGLLVAACDRIERENWKLGSSSGR